MENENINFSLTYYPANVRRCCGVATRGGNDLNRLAEDVFTGIMMLELAAWTEILPEKKLKNACLSKIDTAMLPKFAYEDCVIIKDFIGKHGVGNDSAPSWVMAISMVNCGIWMKRMSVDSNEYYDLLTRLDTNPPKSFSNYIEICIEYKKEMKQ